MDYFSYRNDILHAEDVSIEDIVGRVGTPFYCYSANTLRRHYRIFDDAIPSCFERKICFAVKSNSNVAVLRVLAGLGAGADVVSGGEIRLALAAGISADDIVFSGVGKTEEELRFALEKGIFQFNVESMAELELLSDIASSMGREAAIAVRVNPDVDAKTHAKISTGKKENKFGIPIGRALEFYAKAASLPCVRVQAVSVHIGSQLTDLEPFRVAFTHVCSLVKDLQAAGHNIEWVDLGGGLGIPYDSNIPPLPLEYGKIVADTMSPLVDSCKLIFEPGRVIAGNAGILVSKVIYVKEGESRDFVIIDAAMNDLMRPSLYEAYHEVVPVVRSSARSRIVADIVGPVCETGDTFAVSRDIDDVRSGELVALRSAGAYGASMSSTYNARPLVAEVLVDGDRWAVIRERPSYDDMVAASIVPSWL